MAAHIPKPEKWLFHEINVGKYKTVRHFRCDNLQFNHPILTPLINVTEDRGFAKSKPDLWVKTWIGNKWSKNTLTGLYLVSVDGLVFVGDGRRKQDLLILEFSDKGDLLISLYKNYYPFPKGMPLNQLGKEMAKWLRNLQ